MAESLWGGSARFARQRLEAGDDVEQFLVDTALTQAVKRPVQVLQQLVDIFSARCITARRLAFSLARDSAHALNSETNRYS
jgi:hypothetical protein